MISSSRLTTVGQSSTTHDIPMFKSTYILNGPFVLRIFGALVASILLSFFGDILGRTFNLFVGYPWSQSIHVNIHYLFIAIFAGLGSALPWINTRQPITPILTKIIITIFVAIIALYIAKHLDSGVDQTYWWSKYATSTILHISAAITSTAVAILLHVIESLKGQN
jgi:hypothetical protein